MLNHFGCLSVCFLFSWYLFLSLTLREKKAQVANKSPNLSFKILAVRKKPPSPFILDIRCEPTDQAVRNCTYPWVYPWHLKCINRSGCQKLYLPMGLSLTSEVNQQIRLSETVLTHGSILDIWSESTDQAVRNCTYPWVYPWHPMWINRSGCQELYLPMGLSLASDVNQIRLSGTALTHGFILGIRCESTDEAVINVGPHLELWAPLLNGNPRCGQTQTSFSHCASCCYSHQCLSSTCHQHITSKDDPKQRIITCLIDRNGLKIHSQHFVLIYGLVCKNQHLKVANT